MSTHTLPPGQAVQVECRCGNSVEVTISYRVATRDIDEEAEKIASEYYGWGDAGTCPDCQKRIDRDVAEVQAADQQAELEALTPFQS